MKKNYGCKTNTKKAPALDGQYIYIKGESVSIHFLIRSTQMYHADSLQLS